MGSSGSCIARLLLSTIGGACSAASLAARGLAGPAVLVLVLVSTGLSDPAAATCTMYNDCRSSPGNLAKCHYQLCERCSFLEKQATVVQQALEISATCSRLASDSSHAAL